jgi:hypothetical protein
VGKKGENARRKLDESQHAENGRGDLSKLGGMAGTADLENFELP